jgi:plasmid stability protein
LESRFLTEEMGGRPLRKDIPINMPPSFKDEARELRNKLLLYRFHRKSATAIDESLIDLTLQPRLNQILIPLLSVVSTPALRTDLRAVATNAQANLVAERGLSVEAHVLEILAEHIATPEQTPVTVGIIAAGMTERYGAEYDRPITNRWVGGILRSRLNIRTYKSHGVYVVPASERPKIEILCARYGVGTTNEGLTVQSGDVGTSGTF